MYPYEVAGKRLRVKTDGTQIHKIHLKEDDRKTIEQRLPALALVYKKLTTKIITFEFIHSLAEEKRRKRKTGKKEGKREKSAPKAEEAKVAA